MILHYLVAIDLEEIINNLIDRFPSYKYDGEEMRASCVFQKIDPTDRMTVQLSLNGNSMHLARYMDKLNDFIMNNLKPSPTVLINESSARFNLELYPLVNKFERKLRTMIYLKNAGNNDPEVVDKLETLTFEKIYELLFTDSEFITKMRQIVNDKTRSSSQAFYLREIKNLKENTKWDAIVKSANLDFVKDNFLHIIDFRNDVMHAHNISYLQFYEAKKLITLSIVAIEKEIELLIESSEYRENSQEELLDLLKKLSDDIPNEIIDGLYWLTK